MFVDSHVNLHGDAYAGDLDEVIARAHAVGVRAMLAISDRLSSTDAIKRVVSGRAAMWRSVGVHPHHAKEAPGLDAQTLVALTGDPKVVGIGECGLDNYYAHSPREEQEAVFAAHIEAAQETGLPLIIHSRDADETMARMLAQAHARAPFTPLLHCYTGGPELAETALSLGGYISFSGILTFRNATAVREIAVATPLSRLLIETDCPYLSPVPMRGRRNEPAYVVHVATKLAEVKGVSPEVMEDATTENFFRLFSKASRDSLTGDGA